jgi:energy-coupling factor transporter ATP-binding protein EcfA2
VKILNVKLHKFRRMPLIGSDTVSIDFTKKLNLIFGTNGSGKSKLLKELSPLPPDKEDFYPGGYKYITIEHNGSIYKISSEFGDKVKHSFVKDDEELNPGFTVTVQKDLALQYFRLDSDIHDILIGVTTFTGMNALVRKKLLNLVSNVNIEYVLGVYEGLKEKHKEKTNQLKTQSSLMQSELSKLLAPEQEASIREEIDNVKQFLDSLLVIRALCAKDEPFSTREIVEEYLSTLGRNIDEYLALKHHLLTSYPRCELDTIEAVSNAEISLVDYKLSLCYKSLESLTDTKHVLDTQLVDSSADMYKKLKETENTIEQYKASLVLFKYVPEDKLKETQNLLTTTQYSLMQTLYDMPSNIDKRFNKSAYTDSIAKKQTYQTRLSSIENVLFKAAKTAEHIADHLKNDLTTCPNCNHKWNTQYTQHNLDTANSEVERLTKAKNVCETEIATLTKYIEESVVYFNQHKTVMTARTNTYNLLAPLWDYVSNKDLLMEAPASVSTVLDTAIRDLSTIEQCCLLDEKRKSLLELIRVSETKASTDMGSVVKEIEKKEAEVSELVLLKRDIRLTLDNVASARRAYTHLSCLNDDLKRHTDQLNDVAEAEVADNLLELITDTIRTNKLLLLELQPKLEAADKINYLVARYKQQIDDIKLHVETLEAMIKELSPKNGIIAKSIGGFINRLIVNMNNVIEPIWSYDFSIVPYDVENEEKLDYRFKVMVNGEVATPDVTKTSGGMREVIDLAFRLTVMKFLGLTDYPCYLDEFGIKLDSHHRSRIHSMVAGFVADSNFSQVFLISHQDTSYSNMKDSDVVIISGDNIAYRDSRNILTLT